MQKDYIMRMYEQFAFALASIISLRKSEQYHQALEEMRLCSQGFLNCDLSFFLQCTPDRLIKHFQENNLELDIEKSIICGELIYELALMCQDRRCFEDSLKMKNLALGLFLSIPSKNQLQNQDYLEKIELLKKELKIF